MKRRTPTTPAPLPRARSDAAVALEAAQELRKYAREMREGLTVCGGPDKGKLRATPEDMADIRRFEWLATSLREIARRRLSAKAKVGTKRYA